MKQKKRIMRLRTIIGSTCLLLILMVGPAQATPLNLPLFNFPDISSAGIFVTFDSATEILTADGTAASFDDDGVGPQESISLGIYHIEATIDDLGIVSAGLLEITGTLASLSSPTGILLTGNLIDLGFNPVPDSTLEFLCDVTGGDLAPFFGSMVVSKLSGSGFGGSFASDFTNELFPGAGFGFGVNNLNSVVPEPGTFLLLLGGIGVLFGLRKRLGVG